jgi:hypothetical protein
VKVEKPEGSGGGIYFILLQHDETLLRALDAGTKARKNGGEFASVGPSDEDVAGPSRLWVVGNGHGSPCIDFRRVSSELAAAAGGADLLVLEGMGRALHTNFSTHFKCEVVKVRTTQATAFKGTEDAEKPMSSHMQ